MTMERAASGLGPDCGPSQLEQTAQASTPGPPGPKGQTFHSDFAITDLPDPKLRTLYDIWLEKCQADRLPARQDFDPVDLPPTLLPWITIFDVEGGRFRIRIVGTGIVQVMGQDTTGRYLDELPNTDVLQARARWAVENAKPFYVTDLTMVWDEDRWGRYSVLCTPLAANGTDVDKLLYLMSFDD